MRKNGFKKDLLVLPPCNVFHFYVIFILSISLPYNLHLKVLQRAEIAHAKAVRAILALTTDVILIIYAILI